MPRTASRTRRMGEDAPKSPFAGESHRTFGTERANVRNVPRASCSGHRPCSESISSVRVLIRHPVAAHPALGTTRASMKPLGQIATGDSRQVRFDLGRIARFQRLETVK